MAGGQLELLTYSAILPHLACSAICSTQPGPPGVVSRAWRLRGGSGVQEVSWWGEQAVVYSSEWLAGGCSS